MDKNYASKYDDFKCETCQQQDHYQKYSHICTYKLCEIPRKCCSFCLKDDIHNHSMPNNDHIMDWESFSKKTYKDHNNFQKQFQNNQQAVNNEQFLWLFLKNLQKLRKEIEALEQNVETQLNMLTTRDICPRSDNPNAQQKKLDDNTLNRWIRNQLDFEVEEFQDPLNKIQQQINNELLNLNDYIEKKERQTLKQRKYEIQQIQQIKTDHCNSALISSNEKYIVSNNNDIIQVYDINFQMKLKGYGYDSFVLACDSQYLFAGDLGGNVQGFFFFGSKDFKQFYKQNIHQGLIIQIKIIQNYIITCSSDCSIKKTDFILKRQIFQLKQPWQNISDLSIDYDQQKDILMFASASNKYFKILNCQDQSTLIYTVPEKCEYFQQVQFVNNKQNILCLDDRGSLFKYKIDYQNKQLLKLYEYCDHYEIFGFQQFKNDENLLLIYYWDCRILNKNNELTRTIYHFSQFSRKKTINCSQNSLNNIILIAPKNIYLAKALK